MCPDTSCESVLMYRIRFHGRGGQGLKTAARILGTAFFLEGFEVQDAPRYGAERRGAPIFAYVRASRRPVNERGVIHNPDLVIVADETLTMISATEIMRGITGRTVLMIRTGEKPDTWKKRLAFSGTLLALSAADEAEDSHRFSFAGVSCAGAAARLAGVISRTSLERALRAELSHFGDAVVARNLEAALNSYDLMAPYEGHVTPGREIAADAWENPDWVDLPFEEAGVSAPAVFTPATSNRVKTGLWRSVRPAIDQTLCKRCRMCGAYCPDGCIIFDAADYPDIDYEHCKGCLICMAQCPSRAIRAIPEHDKNREGGVT